MLTFSEPPSFTFNLKIQNSTVNLRGLTKCAPFWLRVGTPSSCSLAWETCVYVFWRITLNWHDMFHDFLLAQLLFDLKCFTPQLHPYTNFWGHQKVSYWNPQHIKVDSGSPTPLEQAKRGWFAAEGATPCVAFVDVESTRLSHWCHHYHQWCWWAALAHWPWRFGTIVNLELGIPRFSCCACVRKAKDRLYIIYILCRYVFVDTDTYAIYIYHMAVPFLSFQVHGIRIQPRHSRDGVGHLVTKSDNDESALEGGKRACCHVFWEPEINDLKTKKKYIISSYSYIQWSMFSIWTAVFHPSRKFQIQKTNMMLQGNRQRKHHLYGRGKPLQAIPSGIATRSLGWDPRKIQGILSFDLGKTPRTLCLNDSSNPCTTYCIYIYIRAWQTQISEKTKHHPVFDSQTKYIYIEI